MTMQNGYISFIIIQEVSMNEIKSGHYSVSLLVDILKIIFSIEVFPCLSVLGSLIAFIFGGLSFIDTSNKFCIISSFISKLGFIIMYLGILGCIIQVLKFLIDSCKEKVSDLLEFYDFPKKDKK
jgi:hypothetical protein